MLSYWEQQSFLNYDHIVIGAGMVGLQTAIELKQKYPDQSVLVLERSLFPYGASTRNAGFACMGSLTELLDDLEHGSVDQMLALFEKRRLGLKQLRLRLGDDAIGYQANGSYELIAPDALVCLDQLAWVNEQLMPLIGSPAFLLANDKIKEFGFPSAQVAALIENTCEGSLDTGKMMRRLTDFASMLGVELKTGANVSHFEEEAQQVVIFISDPTRAEVLPLSCRQLYICTNAFTKKFFPDIDLKPGRGQVLITTPIAQLPFTGIFHMEKGYYYFRTIDNRILLGGGRQLDFDGETTTELQLNNGIQADLEHKLQQLLLPGREVHIAMRWSGIMAFGSNKRPIVQAFGPRIYGAFRMGGMGVALSAEVARELVGLA